VAAALRHHSLPARFLLASGDATAIAAAAEVKTSAFKDLAIDPHMLDTDSHTFARPGDEAMLLAAVTAALRDLGAQAS
jgi:hypothetical protein